MVLKNLKEWPIGILELKSNLSIEEANYDALISMADRNGGVVETGRATFLRRDVIPS